MSSEEQELGKLRDSIDRIDQEILKLINERAECALRVAEVKQAAATGDEEVCDQCEECQACAQNEVGLEELTIASQKDSENNLLSMLSPWITPLGGLLLISAHLLNRRYGCLCGCC